jgi:SAM-dependent methyltransferase
LAVCCETESPAFELTSQSATCFHELKWSPSENHGDLASRRITATSQYDNEALMRDVAAADQQESVFSLFRGSADRERVSSILRTRGPLRGAGLLLRKLAGRIKWWFYYLLHRHSDRAFDKNHGVETCGMAYLESLTVVSPNRENGLEYEPTPVRAFGRMLNAIPERVDGFTFVDFGCGKGRTLLLASRHPFRKVRGVEFARELHETAERNIAVFSDKRQRCSDVEATWLDAAQYKIPDDDCVFYFYYPFHEDVMRKVLDNIAASFHANPRQFYLVNRIDKPEWAETSDRVFADYPDFHRVPDATTGAWQAIWRPFTVSTYCTQFRPRSTI